MGMNITEKGLTPVALKLSSYLMFFFILTYKSVFRIFNYPKAISYHSSYSSYHASG
jgi:hypothetical protein